MRKAGQVSLGDQGHAQRIRYQVGGVRKIQREREGGEKVRVESVSTGRRLRNIEFRALEVSSEYREKRERERG